MMRIFVTSDLCPHPSSDKKIIIWPHQVELECRTCGKVIVTPKGSLSVKMVQPDACLRMAGIDFTPYMQPKPKEP